MRKLLVVVALALVFASSLIIGVAGSVSANNSRVAVLHLPNSCQTVRASAGFDPTVQSGTDPLQHHFYVSIPYQQSGNYAVYDVTLNQWFDQNSGRWGYYGNSTRYGIPTSWAVPNQWHFWTDTWVVFDYNC